MQKITKVMMVVLVMMAIAACGARFNPQTRMYTVYGVSKFKLPDGYQEVGTVNVNILPRTWETGSYPYQSFTTTMFENGEAYIFSQVLTVSNRRYFVRPLKGGSVSMWGINWRKNVYQLTPGSTSLEYRRYFEYIKKKGLPLASTYEVTVYDRLIGRHAITRVMFLKPGTISGHAAMPPAKDLYTLDRDDFRSR